LVEDAEASTLTLFEFLNIKYSRQTIKFIKDCHETHVADQYAVYKSKSVATHWEKQLNPDIIREIYSELTGTDLERYLT
jgi:hypothetical protein